MTLNQFLDEFDNLSAERVHMAERAFLQELLKLDTMQFDYILFDIKDLMEALRTEEDDDFFGTEGMNI
jgi:hypothetical protein